MQMRWLLIIKYYCLSQCSHLGCVLWFFNCIQLVFIRPWGQLVMRNLINYYVLLWLVSFQQLLLVHFDPSCSGELFSQWSAFSQLSWIEMDQSQLLKTNQSQQSIFYFFILFFSSIYLFHKSFILYYKIEKFKMLFLELNIRLQKK